MSSPNESGADNQKYYPPNHDVLVHFARDLGNELGGEFADWEIVQGLADGMSVIAQVLANNLNRKFRDEFDNPVE